MSTERTQHLIVQHPCRWQMQSTKPLKSLDDGPNLGVTIMCDRTIFYAEIYQL